MHRVLVTTLLFVVATSASVAAADHPVRIACLGDSITQGARVDATTESYPARLQNLLGDRYQVANFGLGGATLIKTGRPNVWKKLDAVKKFQPHVVVISLGTNDTVAGLRKNWEKIDRFDDDYSALIKVLGEIPTKPHVVLCTPTPMVLETKGLSVDRLARLTERKPRLQKLCVRVRRLAADHSEDNVSLLELNTALAGHPELFSARDGVHPNRAGYLAVAKAVAKHIHTVAKESVASVRNEQSP